MAVMPIMIAFGNLAIGQLHSLSPILIPFYSNVIILAVSIVVCLSTGDGFFPNEYKERGVGLFWLVAVVCNGFSGYICW
jgi:hypothetical protein